jgi:molybdopterin-guanine dinucleotide biosynthesis protein A
MNAPDPDTRISDFKSQISNLKSPPASSVLRCFIQAGGRSARMGKDKAWLLLNDRPLIEHVLEAAREVTEQLSIIINPASPHADRYQAMAAHWKAEVIADRHDHRGPLGGIDTALSRCERNEAALMLACDLPFMTPEFLKLLRQIHEADSAALTIPLDQSNRAQMLAGIYSVACREPVARMLMWNELMIDRLCLRVSTRLVTFSEYSHLPHAAELLTNLNTEEDYVAARGIAAARAEPVSRPLQK